MANFQSTVRRARYRFVSFKLPAQVIFVLVFLGGVVRLLWLDSGATTSIIVDTALEAESATAPKQSVVKPPTFSANIKDPSIKWEKYAYVLQAGTAESLCNALMMFSELQELGSKAARVLLYPNDWELNSVDEHGEKQDLAAVARLLQLAINTYNVKLELADFMHKNERQAIWTDTFDKVRAFNMTQYERVITLDSDSIILRSLDELFFMQPTPLALPYIYMGEPMGWQLSNHLMVITPSLLDFLAVSVVFENAPSNDYDMDMLAGIYSDRIVRLPQRPYNLLTGEFRRKFHTAYLGSSSETWDATKVLGEAKFVHFADWPVPKPWIKTEEETFLAHLPECEKRGWFENDCTDRQVWKGFYEIFQMRRMKVCGLEAEVRDRQVSVNAVYKDGHWYNVDEVT